MGLTVQLQGNTADASIAEMSVQGELNMHTSPQLRKQLKAILTKYASVRIDLSQVSAIDTAGVATLVEGLQWSRKSGGRFILTGLHQPVRDVLALTRLEGEFDIEAITGVPA